MFSNIGNKIRVWAVILCWLGIAAAVSVGVIFIAHDFALLGLIIAFFGSLSAWIGSWVLYGYGELIDNTSAIREILENQVFRNY